MLADFTYTEAADYDKNVQKKGKDNPCIICGRYVDPDTTQMVHLSYHGGLMANDNDSHPDSQGFFSIGAGCAKKIPAAYLFD